MKVKRDHNHFHPATVIFDKEEEWEWFLDMVNGRRRELIGTGNIGSRESMKWETFICKARGSQWTEFSI